MILNYNRSFWSVAAFSWRELALYLAYTLTLTFFYNELDFHFLSIEETPVMVLGTVVSLLITFRTNSAYDRWWEARKIWGSIVNSSRTFGMQVISLIPDSEGIVHRELIYRHVAYLNALRMQLRSQKSFGELRNHLAFNDLPLFEQAENKATQLNLSQGRQLAALREQGRINEFTHLAMMESLRDFYDQQGAAERINNTPFPVLYDFCTRLVLWTFLTILPIALLDEFGYQTLLYCWGVALVFTEVIRIASMMQDPFANRPNDTPMTSICTAIEIDLRQMLGETDLPQPVRAQHGVLM